MNIDRRIRKSKKALKDALLVQMRKKEIAKISIKELCEQADVNRSTFYANYSDIDALLAEVHNDIFEEMFEALGREHTWFNKERLKDSEEELRAIVQYLKNNRELFGLLLHNNKDNIFEKHMAEYYMQKMMPKEAGMEEKYFFLYHAMGSFSIICQWIADGCKYSVEEVAKLIFQASRGL